MANLFQPSLSRITDANGNPVPNARMYFYLTGTTTPATWYTDQAETTPGTNPLTADSSGKFPTPAYVAAATTYRVRVTDASGTQLWPDADPVRGYDTGMVQTAAETATTAATTATTQAGIATTQAGLAATARTGAETAEANAETAQGLAEDARDAAEAFRDEAEEKADLATTAATTGTLRIQTNPATPATPPSGAGDGEMYWVVDADATKLTLYLNTAGTGAAVSVGGEPVEQPLLASINAVLEPAAPVTLYYPRTLTSDDLRRHIYAEISAPDLMSTPLSVPSNSEEALPLGAAFVGTNTGTSLIEFTSDAAGDATITPAKFGCHYIPPGGSWRIEQRAIDRWVVSGDLISEVNAFTLPILIDKQDLNTMRQERTGDAATTAVEIGDPVGSWRNKGTLGGWATARTDARRPTLQQDATGRYRVVFDGNTTSTEADWLELLGLPLDLAKLNMFVGWQSLSYKNFGGIVALAPLGLSGGGGYNTAWMISQNSSVYPVPADFIISMGASGVNKINANLQVVSPRRPRVIEWRSVSNADPKTITLDGKLIQSTGPGALSALGTVTALESATVRMVIGANNGDDGGQQGAIQFSHTALYGVAGGDSVLSTDQRASIRAYIENAAYPTPHVLPDINDLTELEAARDTLIDEIFGGPLPTDLATVATDSSPPPMGGLAPYISSVEKLTIPGESDPDIKPRVWNPTTPRNDVFAIFFPGHGAGIVENSGEVYGIRPLVQAGVTVASCYLPEGVNDYRAGGDAEHNTIRPPYVKWVRQCVVTINTLLDRFPGAKVIVFGISGGGWATQLCGAVDARIDSTVQFVGSLPADYIFGGDWEQLYTEISADYLTTYLLAAAGGGGDRRHIHVLHENDAVGFNRYTYDARPPFDEALADLAASLGGYYAMEWRDEAFHNLYPSSSTILLAELPTP